MFDKVTNFPNSQKKDELLEWCNTSTSSNLGKWLSAKIESHIFQTLSLFTLSIVIFNHVPETIGMWFLVILVAYLPVQMAFNIRSRIIIAIFPVLMAGNFYFLAWLSYNSGINQFTETTLYPLIMLNINTDNLYNVATFYSIIDFAVYGVLSCILMIFSLATYWFIESISILSRKVLRHCLMTIDYRSKLVKNL